MKPQCERILRHMEKVGGITSKEASDLYGIQRLASRIADLKAANYAITAIVESGENRYGEKVHWKRYFLA